MKTQEEIDRLKQDWQHDPCWDIEETEGFEEHKDELLRYRKKCEKEWGTRANERLQERATKMGIPNNLELAKYIEGLEYQIEQMEKRLHKDIAFAYEKLGIQF
nr:hypothetical protein [uncultured Draconibacterium sp.]